MRASRLRLLVQALFLPRASPRSSSACRGCRFGEKLRPRSCALDPLTPVGTALADWTVPRWAWLGLAGARRHRAFSAGSSADGCAPSERCSSSCPGSAGRGQAQGGGANRWRAGSPRSTSCWPRSSGVGRTGGEPPGLARPAAAAPSRVASGVRPLWHGGAVAGRMGRVCDARADPARLGVDAAVYCRALCPAGALMGLAPGSRRWRIHRTEDTLQRLQAVPVRLPGRGRASWPPSRVRVPRLPQLPRRVRSAGLRFGLAAGRRCRRCRPHWTSADALVTATSRHWPRCP